MKEESQIEDMRAAVRGDRERAEHARRRSFENVPVLTESQQAEEPAEPSGEGRRKLGLRGLFKRR